MKLPPAPSALPTLTFFADASSKDQPYMVAGGFAVAGTRIKEISDHIDNIRADAGMSSEFHWSAYRGGHRKKSAYESLVDYAFQLVREQKAALHIIIAKFAGYDHKKEKGENRDTSVNRMYYQLCLHRVARYYGHARAIHVRLDAGNDCEDICDMRNELCADAYKRYSAKQDCRPNCIRTIQPMNSKSANIIQMADVILGGVAAKKNEVVHASAKGPLSDYILAASGRKDWSRNTAMDARFLTVWNHVSKVSGTP